MNIHSGNSAAQVTQYQFRVQSATAVDTRRRILPLKPSPCFLLLAGLLWTGTAWSAPAILTGENNVQPNLCQGTAAATWAASAITSKAITPATPSLTVAKIAADTGSFLANIGLKMCSPAIVAPDIAKKHPNTGTPDSTDKSTNSCMATFNQPFTKGTYKNWWGIPTKSYMFAAAGDLVGLTTWGDLGRPLVFHFNTDVDVRLIDPNKEEGSQDDQWDPDANGNIFLPVGRNYVLWRGDTMMALTDLTPTFLIPYIAPGDKIAQKLVMKNKWLSEKIYKAYGRLTRYGDGGTVRRLLSKLLVNKIKDSLENMPATVVEKIMGGFPNTDWRTNYLLGFPATRGLVSASNAAPQEVWVYDLINPTLQTNTDQSTFPSHLQPLLSYDPTTSTYYVEAYAPRISDFTISEFGKALLTASDECQGDRPPLVPVRQGLPDRAFWVSGDTSTFQWQVEDSGPNLAGGSNPSNIVAQTFAVRDTNPPALIAPPSQVLEIPVTSPTAAVSLGSPRVFDLADLSPDVTNDVNNDPSAIVDFNPGINTVTWTAVDDAGNTVTQEQIINVKYEGANTAPVAYDRTVSAISYRPVDIILQGADDDFDPNTGRHDPLNFTIKDKPTNGFFIAPLLPYFIDDYRLEASALRFAGQLDQENPSQYCTNVSNDQYQMKYPYLSRWFSVDDDGTTVFYDQGDIACQFGATEARFRLGVIDANGDLIHVNQINVPTIKDIYINRETKGVYAVDNPDPGAPNQVFVYDKQLNSLGIFTLDYIDKFGSPNRLTGEAFIGADSQGIIYVGGKGSGWNVVLAYQGPTSATQVGTYNTYKFLGILHEDSKMGGVDTDSEDNVYVSRGDRILKFSPSYFNELGEFVPGTLIGWMGRCDSNLTNTYACDTVNKHSIGYSCTDALCGTSTPSNYGADPAQFNDARGIAIDPHDILYVSDYGNSRVQRFMPEGDFAGQAKSNGVGYGFVLGDFGRPEDLTVNSDHFYILKNSLLHVLKTTPVTPIDDNSAMVTYQSDNNFVGTDTFTFEATDGLASDIGTVTINVERDYRPPEISVPPQYVLNEDSSVEITLVGSDPDGALDTLSYTVVEPPAHGMLSYVGAALIYTPDPDFNGQDSFSYIASDGIYNSSPAVVDLTVDPVDDPPQVTTEPLVAEGLGFEFQFPIQVFDPDADESLLVSVDWGDGSPVETSGVILQNGVLVTGDYLLPDGSVPSDYVFTGPLLTMDSENSGSVTFKHAYDTAADHVAMICVTDRIQVLTDGTQLPTTPSQTACGSTTFSVSLRNDLLLSVEPDAAQADAGATVTNTITVVNRPFDIIVPAVASVPDVTNIVINGTIGDDLIVTSADSADASCTQANGVFDCTLSAPLSSGATAVVTVATQISTLAPGNALLSLTANRQADGIVSLEEEALGIAQVNASANPPSQLVLSATTASTAGGTPLTVTGQDFDVYAEVLIDNNPATDIEVIDAGTITLTVPAHIEGVVDVTVVNSDGQSATLPGALTYVTPVVVNNNKSGSGGFGPVGLMILLFLATLIGCARTQAVYRQGP